MKVIRLLLANQEEIQQAKMYNQGRAAEGATQDLNPNAFLKVPEPLWEEVPFSFPIRNVNSYYVDNDIIANLMYDGIVRLKYNPVLENQLEMYFSLYG
jgi:hypothetical protein